MRQKLLTDINGITYMSPGCAASRWGLSTQKVTSACEKGLIEGATKDSGEKWIIPIDSKKPMAIEHIRELLIAILALKNKVSTKPDEFSSRHVTELFDYLKNLGYIESFNIDSDLFPADVVLTGKGMSLATEGKHISIDWLNACGVITNCLSIAVTLWSII